MKKKLIILMVALLTLLSACGQASSISTPIDEKNESAQEESVDVANTEEVVEEEIEEESPCEKNGHTWIEATCIEPKTCSVCGETEGEPLGHEWMENTPNYQQAKTCAVCGETEGEPLEAALAGTDFVEADKEYDFEVMCTRDHSKTTVEKVTFANYKVFDSDETHDAKEGYEWKSVDIIYNAGDDNSVSYGCHTAYCVGEYYQDNDIGEDGSFTVSFNGEDYDGCLMECTDKTRDGVTDNSYKDKYGWSGKYVFEGNTNYTFLVPKGFDGMTVFLLDFNEYLEKNEDIDACDHRIYFRLM